MNSDTRIIMVSSCAGCTFHRKIPMTIENEQAFLGHEHYIGFCQVFGCFGCFKSLSKIGCYKDCLDTIGLFLSSSITKLFLSPNYVLYFAILILIGDVLDVGLTFNLRITQPTNFYIFEQNMFFKNYVGTELWFVPVFISLSFSLLLIYLTNKFSDTMVRLGLLYFGLFTYAYSISWITGFKIYLYFHVIYLAIFAMGLFIEIKRKKYFKHPSFG